MPTIPAESLIARLTKSKVAPPLLVLGRDVYLRQAFREQIIEACIDPATRGWAISRFSAADSEFPNALAQARTVPMLARRQLVIVTELESVEQMPERERDAEIQNLTDYFKDPAPFTVLILEANQLDQRMKFARMLSEQALVLAAELPEDPRERSRLAATLASQMARDRNSAIEDDAADALADLCNGDLGAIQSEIDKLATYAGAGKAIRRADVEALVIAEKKYTVWELADVLATRQRERAFRFLANVWQQGETAPALIGAMAWMCRKLIEAQQLSPQISAYQAADRLKMRPASAEAAIRHARKIPRRQLVEGLRALYDADSSVKGGSPDDRAVMEFVLARLLGSPGKAGDEPDRAKAGNSKPGV
jgi:DNA polymerase III subunit delta